MKIQHIKDDIWEVTPSDEGEMVRVMVLTVYKEWSAATGQTVEAIDFEQPIKLVKDLTDWEAYNIVVRDYLFHRTGRSVSYPDKSRTTLHSTENEVRRRVETTMKLKQ